MDAELRKFVRSLELPVVDLSVFGTAAGLPCLDFDANQIGRLAAEHFLERGFRHFGWYPALQTKPFLFRQSGFDRALAEHGLRPTSIHPMDAEQSEGGWQTAERDLGERLRGLPRPVGILVFNDEWGVQILRACERVGLRVPEEVAVLGVDNQTLVCEHLPVPLSSVELDLEASGKQAASMLDQYMRVPSAWKNAQQEAQLCLIQPSRVIARGSTDFIAVEHPAVARALDFIARHYTDPIGVDEVVTVSRLSRSGLKQAFRKHLRRSVNEEIQRTRIEAVRRMLASSTLSIESVAQETGLKNARNLHRLFKRYESVSASEYRQRNAHSAT